MSIIFFFISGFFLNSVLGALFFTKGYSLSPSLFLFYCFRLFLFLVRIPYFLNLSISLWLQFWLMGWSDCSQLFLVKELCLDQIFWVNFFGFCCLFDVSPDLFECIESVIWCVFLCYRFTSWLRYGRNCSDLFVLSLKNHNFFFLEWKINRLNASRGCTYIFWVLG